MTHKRFIRQITSPSQLRPKRAPDSRFCVERIIEPDVAHAVDARVGYFELEQQHEQAVQIVTLMPAPGLDGAVNRRAHREHRVRRLKFKVPPL